MDHRRGTTKIWSREKLRKNLPELRLREPVRVRQASREGVSELVKIPGRGGTWAKAGSREVHVRGGVWGVSVL